MSLNEGATPESIQPEHEESGRSAPAVASGDWLRAWWRQGWRTLLLRRPDWPSAKATPGIVAGLFAVAVIARILSERLYIDGPASFYWQAIRIGWWGTVATIWVCWLLVPRAPEAPADEPAGAAALFAMLTSQQMVAIVLSGILFVPLTHLPFFTSEMSGRWIAWGAGAAVSLWYLVARVALIWRVSSRSPALRIGAAAILVAGFSLQQWFEPARFWYPNAPDAEASASDSFRLSQELMELQPRILQEQLQALRAERPGVIDVYAVTFAPYAGQDVFRRESNLVASVMEERFGAAGRTVQLVNSSGTVRDWAWATPLNLRRTIQRVAEVMNRDEDVLFIHLTSHGGRDGKLSAEFWPLAVDSLTPQMLRTWLDEAGIRNRVISVSACFSGSWIEPLTDSGTLVMTAADATHTSYGCGSTSPLTFFGMAMYDEQLRRTWSFERAHAAARLVIEQREVAAGKSDGYSNPQISVGDRIRERLRLLEEQFAERL